MGYPIFRGRQRSHSELWMVLRQIKRAVPSIMEIRKGAIQAGSDHLGSADCTGYHPRLPIFLGQTWTDHLEERYGRDKDARTLPSGLFRLAQWHLSKSLVVGHGSLDGGMDAA